MTNISRIARLTCCLAAAALAVTALHRSASANDELDFIDRPLVSPEPPPSSVDGKLAFPKIASWSILVGGNFAPDPSTAGGLLVASFSTEVKKVGLETSLSASGSALNQDGRAGAFGLEIDTQPELLKGSKGGGELSFAPGIEISNTGDLSGALTLYAKYVARMPEDSREIYSAALSVIGGYGDEASYSAVGTLSAGRKVGKKTTLSLALKPAVGAAPLDGDPAFSGTVEAMYMRPLAGRDVRLIVGGKAGDVSDLEATASVIFKAFFAL